MYMYMKIHHSYVTLMYVCVRVCLFVQVVTAGGELFTGNTAFLAAACIEGKANIGDVSAVYMCYYLTYMCYDLTYVL